MVRKLFLFSITGFWLVIMSLLVQKEYFGLTTLQNAYEILPINASAMRESYFALKLGKSRLGFSHAILISNDYDPETDAKVEKEEETPEAPFSFKHKSYLSFLLLGRENETFFKGEADLDEQLYLQKFDLFVKNQAVTSNISGVYANGKMTTEITDSDGNTTEKVTPLANPVLHSESLVFLWTPQNLRIGKRGRLLVWNPLLLQTEDIEFFVSHITKMNHLDEEVEVYVVVLNKGEIETKLWVSTEGETLQMETATGVLMHKEPGWMIFDAMRDKKNKAPDLPNLFSIPSNVELKNHERLTYLKAKLTLPNEEKIVEIRKVDLNRFETVPFPLPRPSQELTKYLEASDYVEADNADIRALAKEIVGDEKFALNASLQIISWVNRNVSPIPTSGIPSALQVLSSRQGDCNEYTVLFTALSRAAGIPTRMVAGIVYQAGSFFYHAWPEVFLTEWVPLDPTFGQAPVDVTHIPLADGNMQEQIGIVNMLGNLQINILESK